RGVTPRLPPPEAVAPHAPVRPPRTARQRCRSVVETRFPTPGGPMGRTFENRKHALAKRSDRDAKAFTRAGRNIAMAVRAGGPDPEANSALRHAIQNARAVNMPKDKIQGAIDKAAGLGDGADYQEVVYEGYGPHGIAVMVVTATDNPTRTVANIRFAFKKVNGTLGNSGSVAFMFD